MLRFSKIITNCANPVTTLTLPWHLRLKSRQRVTLDNGEEAGLFLEHGSILRGGDCVQAENGITVRILAAKETVSIVRCASPLQLARICYHLGNRHVDIEISKHHVCYLHDHVLDAMIESMGLAVWVDQIPFEPETGAYSGGHAHQGHVHE